MVRLRKIFVRCCPAVSVKYYLKGVNIKTFNIIFNKWSLQWIPHLTMSLNPSVKYMAPEENGDKTKDIFSPKSTLNLFECSFINMKDPKITDFTKFLISEIFQKCWTNFREYLKTKVINSSRHQWNPPETELFESWF